MKTQIKTLLKITALLIIVASVTGCISVDGIINNNTSFKELHEHLGKHIGEEVTVRGYIEMVSSFNTQVDATILFDAAYDAHYLILLTNISDVNICRGWYTITGTVESNNMLSVYTCTIAVTSAKAE